MKCLLALLILVSSTVVCAQSRIVSVDAFDLAYSGGLVFQTHKGDDEDKDVSKFRFNLNFAQNFMDYVGLMWKAKINFNREDVDFGSNDSLESSYGAAGGFLYNFQSEDVKNSILVSALVGIERASYEIGNQDSESGFNVYLDLEAGKRWDLGQYSVANISYAPTVAVNFKRYGGDIRDEYYTSAYELRLNFLKFDVLF